MDEDVPRVKPSGWLEEQIANPGALAVIIFAGMLGCVPIVFVCCLVGLSRFKNKEAKKTAQMALVFCGLFSVATVLYVIGKRNHWWPHS